MKIRRRLGESPPLVALYGPLIVTVLIAGCVPRLRIRGLSVVSSRASVRCTNVTPINLGPAFSVSGNSIGPTAAPRPRPPALPLLAPAGGLAPLPGTAGRSTEGGVGSGSDGSGCPGGASTVGAPRPP